MKKNEAAKMETIAVSNYYKGMEIKHIEHGIDDFIYCVTFDKKPHKCKIHYCTERPFFVVDGKRIYIDEFIKV